MSDSGSLAPSDRVPLPQRPQRHEVALPAPQPRQPPTYAADDMTLDSNKPARDAAWQSLGPVIRDRLRQRAGTSIEWWARIDPSADDRRIQAVIFGTNGLFTAQPRLDADHKPVYAITGFQIDPTSLRHTVIDHRPPRKPRRSRTEKSTPDARAADPDDAPAGLGIHARGLLGNLPPQAQELLQEPFHRGQEVRSCDWYYQGFEHDIKVFILYLAGAHDLTVATGKKLIPAGRTDATAHWSLKIHHATVVRRIGT